MPLGYDNVAKKLVINEAEAETIRSIFRLYLERGCVRQVKQEADRFGLKTKARVDRHGNKSGKLCFSRGHLFQMLSNPLYAGKVRHRGQVYDGEHEAIIDQRAWDAVQAQLKQNASDRRSATNAKSPSLLTGLLEDENGHRLVPSHACKPGRRYRYYISVDAEDGRPGSGWRLPAREIEETVIAGVAGMLRDRLLLMKGLGLPRARPEQLESLFERAQEFATALCAAGVLEKRKQLQQIVQCVEVRLDRIRIELDTSQLLNLLGHGDHDGASDQAFIIKLPVRLRRRGVEKKIIITSGNQPSAKPDANLIKTVTQGWYWFGQLRSGEFGTIREIAKHNKTDGENVTRTMRLAFLAPDIIGSILEGYQPPDLTAFGLKRIRNLPLSWDDQRKMLGFPSSTRS